MSALPPSSLFPVSSLGSRYHMPQFAGFGGCTPAAAAAVASEAFLRIFFLNLYITEFGAKAVSYRTTFVPLGRCSCCVLSCPKMAPTGE